MDLIPESIKGSNTQALDQTFLERLMNLGVEQLSIDFANEYDRTKLSLWLQQFGIPLELLPDNLDSFTLRDLLPLTIKIHNLSGTVMSIELLAQALGADKAEIIEGDFILDYNCQARHDGLFQYDQGREYRSFAIDIRLQGIDIEKRATFENAFRKLFALFEPMHLYLKNITFSFDERTLVLSSQNGAIITINNNEALDLEEYEHNR